MRIYGRTHGEQALETVLTDTVVFTLLSERKLGPKLHGIFPGGRIEQYIPVIYCYYLIGFSRRKEIELLTYLILGTYSHVIVLLQFQHKN